MIWRRVHRSDQTARSIADRHYNRQSIGAREFVPPGRCLVLLAGDARALWITSWQYPEFAHHAWPGAWICSAFRNEGAGLSSGLIRDAVAATIAVMGQPSELGMITFVRPEMVRPKRDPGYCFLMAGFKPCGQTGKGYLAFQILPHEMPEPAIPAGLLI